jgi:hypothetical protein
MHLFHLRQIALKFSKIGAIILVLYLQFFSNIKIRLLYFKRAKATWTFFLNIPIEKNLGP